MKVLPFCLISCGLLFAADNHKAKLDHPSSTNQPGPNSWQSVGPAPPAIPAAIASHAPSHTIYIGSLGGGILKSTDGGATFVALTGGGVRSMVMDPNDPNVVYAEGVKT